MRVKSTGPAAQILRALIARPLTRRELCAATLVRMYELVRFDLERRGGWADVMARINGDAK